MQDKNGINFTKKALLEKIIKYFMSGSLSDNIDKIPIEIRSKDLVSSRCCIYKDRAVLKYRIMSMLGINIKDERDETKLLKNYLENALNRKENEIDEKFLMISDIACSQCNLSKYFITNACKGCFSRVCEFNCPRQAIKVINGKSIIDYKKCINCGICAKVCPYHSIIYISIPCEEVCPVGAIKRNIEKNIQEIDFNKCILCGKCMHVCPFEAIFEKSELIDVLKLIKSGKKVVAMIAPSIAGQFPYSIEKIASGIKKIGFFKVEEVAFGADLTTENETIEFIEKMKEGQRLMTSSCCTSYILAVKKHVRELEKFVSHTLSPMRFISKTIKEENLDYITVFIGPCLAKKKEAIDDINTDFVLTFEELDAIISALGINLAEMEDYVFTRKIKGSGRGYATSCGVSAAILKEMHTEDITKIDNKFINGINKKSLMILKLYADGKLPGNFLEVMACEGGCVGGPCTIEKVNKATEVIKKEVLKD